MSLSVKYNDSSLELESSKAGLLDLAEKMQTNRDIQRISLSHPITSPNPYLGYADFLTLEPSSGNVYIGRRGREVRISGAPEKLEILAGNIEFLANDEDDNSKSHIHIEYRPGHFYLREKSMPLVITKNDQD